MEKFTRHLPPGGMIPGPMPENKQHNTEQDMQASMKGMNQSDLAKGHSTTPMGGIPQLNSFDYIPFV